MHFYLAMLAIGIASLTLGYIIRGIVDDRLTNRRLIIAGAMTAVAFVLLLALYI
jgi:hypothetical protein